MAIDKAELESWILSDEGKAWADGLKKPLLDKRDELLKALKDGNAALSASAQRAADADRLLSDERAAFGKVIIDDAIAAKLKSSSVFEATIPTATAAIKELYGLTAKADGLERKVIGKLEGREIGLDEALDHWLLSDMGKANIPASINAGSSAHGGAGHGSGVGSRPLAEFENLSPAARMDFVRQGGTIN